MCSIFRRCQEVFQSLNIPNTYTNSVYDHCACLSCVQRDGNQEDPTGCCYFALQADPRRNLQQIYAEWHKCFHGTNQEHARSIAINGLLMPGDKVSTTNPIAIKEWHVPKQQFVFSSPIHDYSLQPTYALPYLAGGHEYQFVFELRFKPGGYQNMGAEWKTDLRDCVIEIAILLFEDYHGPGRDFNAVMRMLAPPVP